MHSKKIIHFTNTYGSLFSILNDSGFQLSYCSEIFTVGADKVSSAVHPMVCFSAYSTQELNGRNITYGRYAIVMCDNWVEANKITPVLYVDRFSQAALALGKMLRARQGKERFELPKELRLPVIQLKCFTKNARGYNSYFEQENFRFYEENEWRYVPTLSELEGARLSQNLSTYKNNKLNHMLKLSGHTLDFEIDDVEKVYVQHDIEIPKVKKVCGSSTVVEVSPWVTDLKAYNNAN